MPALIQRRTVVVETLAYSAASRIETSFRVLGCWGKAITTASDVIVYIRFPAEPRNEIWAWYNGATAAGSFHEQGRLSLALPTSRQGDGAY